MFFPVSVPYRTWPSMTKSDHHPNATPIDLHYLTHKRHAMTHQGPDCWANLRPDLVKKTSVLLGGAATSDVCDLALRYKEDIAIMHQGQLVSICFCFPSGWVPASRVGQTLTEIHGAVADGDKLREASSRIAEIMCGEHSFTRGVWTISTTGELSNHPSVAKPKVTEQTDIADLWFRTETQTTRPLGDGESSVFMVLVETIPLTEIWQEQDRRTLLMQSLNSMTDAVIDYKHLGAIRSRLQHLNNA